MKKNLKADTAVFPAPVYIVGTYGKDNEPTAMNAAWGGVCSSTPPCVMISIRKERYTYENIMQRKAFTINFPDSKHAAEADFCGLVSGNKVNKFQLTGIKSVRGSAVEAPVIEDFPMALECKYVESFEIGSHIMIVGEVVNISVNEECINEDGVIDINKVDPLIYDTTGNKYNRVGDVIGEAFNIGKKFL